MGKSYRFDLPLHPNGYHFGNRGQGPLGSEIASAGADGPGFGFASVAPGEMDQEMRFRITRWPTLGKLIAETNTAFFYEGDTDSFDFTKELNGISGPDDSKTVTLNMGLIRVNKQYPQTYAIKGRTLNRQYPQTYSVQAQPTPSGPTGELSAQTTPSANSQRFVGTTANATSLTYLLAEAGGGASIGPTSVAIVNNAFDFTVSNIPAGTYVPALSLTGPDGTAEIEGEMAFQVTAPIVVPPPDEVVVVPVFAPSSARTLVVQLDSTEFVAGKSFIMTNPRKPALRVDPDSVTDISFDWGPWATECGDTLKGSSFDVPTGVTIRAVARTGGLCSVFVSVAGVDVSAGPVKIPITSRIETNSTPPRKDDRTAYLIVAQR